MRSRPLYLESFLLSLAALLLEVSYTRVFSFKLVYYFTYLIIGISLLGLGSGGVFVSIFPRLRRMPVSRLISACCLAGGIGVLAGYRLVAGVQLNASTLLGGLNAPALLELVKLLVICLCLFVPFLAAGIALAAIFSTQTVRINQLYFADLLGAGLGCALAIPLMVTLTPPACVMLAGCCFTLAGVRLAAESARPMLVPLAAVAGMLMLGVGWPSRLPDPVVDSAKTMTKDQAANVLFSQWSPVFRVDVLRFDPNALLLSHDGWWGSVIRRFDGTDATLTHYDRDERAHPFRLLGPGPRVGIVGSAGGNEILASLYFGAREVTGIELNPVTVSLLTTHFAEFSGRIAYEPRVRLVNAEARSFLRSTRDRYDLIWLVAPDSYAAMNAAMSGAFVLSESYLYTVEMIVDAAGRLTEGGILCAQFGEVDFDTKPNRTARFLATAREGFERLGIHDFERHVLVGTSPGFVIRNTSTILLRREPFTEVDVRRFAESTALVGKDARVRFAWTQGEDGRPPGPVTDVISLPPEALEEWYDRYPFNVRPVTDNSPFFWHFVSFADLVDPAVRTGQANPEEGRGERLLVVLLLVGTLFAAVFLLLPLLAIRDVWRAMPYKRYAAVYFAALGLGFMFFEVSLIQRLTLLLGYPTYSLTVTLFAILVSTGVGSLVSQRFIAHRKATLVVLIVTLATLLVFYEVGLWPIVDRGVGWPLGMRVGVAIAVLAPLGLCAGVFMPLGLRTVSSVSRHGEEYVAWAWAVNGFSSVVSSVLATILSMTFGFSAVMAAAFAIYCLGVAALTRIPVAAPGR